MCGSTPNNFELVQAEGRVRRVVGCESFTVTTVVDRFSGQIVSVQMTNPLQLDRTLCQDEALTECTPIPPTTLQRTVLYVRGRLGSMGEAEAGMASGRIGPARR